MGAALVLLSHKTVRLSADFTLYYITSRIKSFQSEIHAVTHEHIKRFAKALLFIPFTEYKLVPVLPMVGWP